MPPKEVQKELSPLSEVSYEPAPDIQEDAAALAARLRPAITQFTNVGMANLLPLVGAGIHAVSTSASGLLCGLHALVYSYNAARDLAAPEGTPVPLADNPTARELIAFRKTPEFWEEARTYLTDSHFGIDFIDDQGVVLGKSQIMEQVKVYIPDDPNNFEISTLHAILSYLNKKYGTHYILAHIIQGFNVQWDVQKKAWDTEFHQHTQDRDAGIGIRPLLWLYNDNAESEENSLHRRVEGGPNIIGHWMGLSTLHRNLDQELIERTHAWFPDLVDPYLARGVWIVTADIEGYQVDLEDHQDVRELQLYAGCFVTEPTKEPPVDDPDDNIWVPPEAPPDGYMWVQTCPRVNGVERRGEIGIVPLARIKKIEKDALRKAHDLAGVTAANIIKKTGVKGAPSGLLIDFYIHRTIEPTYKIDRKYGNPKNAAKKFVGGFTFEDGEFLLDTQEKLVNLYPRMIKMDGTSGRVKPRNLQQLESAWGLPTELPLATSGIKKQQVTGGIPGKNAILAPASKDKASPRYRYRPGMKEKDFTIKHLREHCQSRGYNNKDYGRKKETMLALLIQHDEEQGESKKITGTASAQPDYGLPMRRVIADVPKQAGPPKMPPFFATEIVMEIGQGDADNQAVWVKDYEGRVGRIDEDNLEPIGGAWGLEIDMLRFNQILNGIRQKAGWGKPSKIPQSPDPKAKVPDPNAKAPTPKAADKKRAASDPVEPVAKKVKMTPASKDNSAEPVAADPSKKASADADDDDAVPDAPPPTKKAKMQPKKTSAKKTSAKKTSAKETRAKKTTPKEKK